jgi:hypothetical protein
MDKSKGAPLGTTTTSNISQINNLLTPDENSGSSDQELTISQTPKNLDNPTLILDGSLQIPPRRNLLENLDWIILQTHQIPKILQLVKNQILFLKNGKTSLR